MLAVGPAAAGGAAEGAGLAVAAEGATAVAGGGGASDDFEQDAARSAAPTRRREARMTGRYAAAREASTLGVLPRYSSVKRALTSSGNAFITERNGASAT